MLCSFPILLETRCSIFLSSVVNFRLISILLVGEGVEDVRASSRPPWGCAQPGRAAEVPRVLRADGRSAVHASGHKFFKIWLFPVSLTYCTAYLILNVWNSGWFVGSLCFWASRIRNPIGSFRFLIKVFERTKIMVGIVYKKISFLNFIIKILKIWKKDLFASSLKIFVRIRIRIATKMSRIRNTGEKRYADLNLALIFYLLDCFLAC